MSAALLSRVQAKLEEMKARCDAATPEPWSYDGTGIVWAITRRSFDGEQDLVRRVGEFDTYENGKLTATARTDLPALVGWALEMVAEWKKFSKEHDGLGAWDEYRIESLAKALGVDVGSEKETR